MKNLFVLCLVLFLCGCASQTPQQKFSSYSTSQLQLRRQQLHDEIPDTIIKIGIWGKDYGDERKEMQTIEMELLRRYDAGDQKAVLQPLPPHEHGTVRGGNF